MTGRARTWLAALLALPALLGAAAAQAAFTFTRITSPTFYTDTSVTPQLPCNYVGFAVTSTTAVADAWATIGGYSSNLANSPYEDGQHHLGSFSAGQTKHAFFYVCSSFTGTTLAGQGYTVSVLDRSAAVAGAATLGSQSFTTTINNDVIQANPNSVSVIFAGPNPAVLGGIITMTVEGDTGTIGSAPGPNGPLAFTPAAYSDWRADAYELVSSNVTLSGGNSGSFDNQLYFASLPSSSTTHYVVTYRFRAVTTTSTATNLSPIAQIASGTQIKHTSTTSGAYGGQLLPIDSATNALRLSKLVSAATLPNTGGTVTYTLRLTNSSSYDIVVDDFVDTLPAGVSYVNNSSTYGGLSLPNPFQTGQQLTWNSTFTVPGNSSRDLVFQAVIPATGGLYTNSAVAHIGTTVIDTTLTTSDNAPATAATRVLGPAAVAKSFTPVAVAAGNPLTLTITLTNNNTATTLTGLAIGDTYPSGLVNHSMPNAATNCPGAVLSGGIAGGNSIGLSGASLAPGASCTITVSVTSATSAAYTNTTGNVTSSNGGTGGTASALATFTTKPALTKSFTPASVPLGSTSRVTILVTNNNTVSLTGLAFSDPLPAGMSVAATPNAANSCGGSLTGATAGSTSVALSGGLITLPATTCQVAFDVVAGAAGTYSNVTTGATSTETGTAGPVSNAAELTVMAPPVASKAFTPAAIARNEPGSLTITLSNPNAAAITGVAFTDNYPSGLVNAGTPGGSTTCGGTVAATSGGGSVSLAGGSIPAGGSCTVTVNVTSATAGTYANTIAAGGVTSSNAGSSTAAASATLTVTNKPTIAKAFAVSLATGVTTMTITVTNNHTTGLTGIVFSDTFPSGMVVDATPSLTNSCGGTVSGGTAGSTSLSLSGGSIAAAGASCTISIRIAVNTSGVYTNQTTGVSSTQTGAAGNPSNVATLVAPGLTKTFSPSTIGPGDVARLTVIVTNPSGTAQLTNLQFSDTYPSGLVNTATPAVANTCGGSTTGGAAAGSTFGLAGGTLAAGATCSISINVTSNTVNSYYNQTGTVRSDQGVGTDGADTLYVTARPTITKSFSPATILAGGFSTMTLVVENNHTAGITGLAFSDPFPAGLVVRTPASNTNTCGGTLGAAAGATSVSLSGGAIGTANGTCTITVQVSAAAQGTYANQTNGATSTTTGATPGPRSNIANLQVNLPPPTVAKAFSPTTVGVNTASALTITLTNASAEAVTGVNLTDTYPAGLVNSGVNDAATTCGGSATAAGGTGTLTLVGGSIPANGSCTVTVSVESATAGSYVNNTGDVTTANAGTATGAQATLTVLAALGATKSFATSPVGTNVPVALSVVISNPNAQAATGVAFTDTYPAGLVNAATPAGAISGAGCSGTVNATAGGANVTLGGATIPASGSCTVTVNVQAAAAGSYVNSIPAGGVTSANAGASAAAANATLTVLAPLAITKAFAPASIGTGDTSVLTITLTNPNAVAVTGAAFTDAYPAGLVNTAAANAATTCTPATVTGANGGASVELAGATVPANGSCTVSVNVTSATAGTYNNTTGAVTTTNAGSAAAAAASLTVLAHPTATKAFAPASVAPGAAAVMTITITNPNASALAGVAFTDTYPAGLVNTATPAGAVTSTGCSGTVTAAAGGNTLVLADGAVPANGSCAVTVNVSAAAAGSYANTLPANTITTTNAGAVIATTSGTLVVTDPLTVAKAFAPAAIGTGDTSVVTITLTNPNTVALTNIAFTDSYPANLVNTATPAGTSSCGGSVTAAAGGASLALSGATLAAGSACTITANVTSATAGSYLNSTGAVTADNAAPSTAATATLDVLSHVVVTKSFTPDTVGAGEAATLTIRLANPNATTALTDAAFTDTYVANLVNASPTGLVNGCGGTATASAGGSSVALAGGTVPAGGFCEISVSVTSAVAGSYINSLAAGAVTTTNGGANTAAASSTLTVLARPTIAKSFAPSPIAIGGASTLTVTLTNPNAGAAITGAAFTDTYPANVVNGATPNAVSSCGGTATAVAGANTLQLAGGTIPAGGSCTVTVELTASASGSHVNTIAAGALTTTNAGSNAVAASATLEVNARPTIAKSFSPNPVAVDTPSVLTITITNGNSVAITGAAFTDTYPVGLVNAATPAGAISGAGCSGAVTAVAGAGTLELGGGNIPANASCTVTVNVTPTAAGSLVNTLAAGALTTSNAGSNAAPASDTLSSLARPTVAKAFAPNPAAVGAPVVLTITLGNTNAVAITGVAFTDTYPANLVNTGTPAGAITGTGCSGTVTAAAGAGSLTLADGVVPANGTCSVTVNVQATAAGSLANTLAAGAVTSNNAGSNTVAASDTLSAFAALVAAKSFSPTSVGVNAPSVLTITLTNGNAAAATDVAFTDNYPSGLVNTATPAAAITGAGCSGTVAATAGGNSLTLSGGSVPGNGSCVVTVNVTSATAGSYVNSSGPVTTSNAGTAPAHSATLTVLARPAATKAFAPNPIEVGGTSVLTVTLTNGNATAITGVAFTDTYPSGLVNTAAPAGAISGAGCSGTVTATGSGNSLALGGATLPANGTCTVTVNVTSAASGSYANTIPAGGVTSTNAGASTVAASATLVVMARPTITKAFAPNPIAPGGTSSLAFTLTNPNATAITGAAFTDTYPSGLVNTATPAGALSGAGCSGTVTASGGGNTVALASGEIPPNGSCTVTVDVTAAAPGSYVNTLAAGGLTTTNAGTNAAAATDTLVVLAPPTFTKGFAPNPVAVGQDSVLTFTIGNGNAVAITGAAFTDTYPAGLVNAAAPAGAVSGAGCSGTVSAVAAGGTVSLSGGNIPANGSCTLTVNVTASSAGSLVNTVPAGGLTTTNAGSSTAAATDTLVVAARPTITKAFAPNPIAVGGASVLTITIGNPNSTAISGAAFTDNYPANLVNAATPAAAISGAGCSGSVDATAGGSTLTLSGGAIPANGSCTVTVNVTATAAGALVNTIPAGALTTTNAGSNTVAAADTLNVNAQPTIAKGFAPNPVAVGGTSVLTITIANSNSVAISGAAFTDTYPANLVNAAAPAGSIGGAGCSGTVTANAGGPSVALSGGTIPANGSCTITVNVTPTAAGDLVNTIAAGALTTGNAGSNVAAASDTLIALAPPAITKSFAPNPIAVGGTSVLTITLGNTNATAITGAAFTDDYPANLVNTATPASAINGAGCSGTVTAAAGGSSLVLSGGTIPAKGSCTVTVNVTASAAGSLVNTIAAGALTTANAGSNTAPATDTLVALAAPTVAKSFTPASIALGGASVLAVTITNSNATAITGVAFTDNYPANLLNTTTPAGAISGAGCSGSVTASAGGTSLALSGATIPANGSCTVSANVTTTAAGTFDNTLAAGSVTSTNAGSNAAPAASTLTVMAPPAVAKSFSPNPVNVNANSTLTITLTNPNASAITGAAFTDTYPAGLVNAPAPGAAITGAGCSGVVSATAGAGSVSLGNGTIPANASCSVIVSVISASPGSYANTLPAGSVTTTNAGSSTTAASDTLDVLGALNILKDFTPATIGVNATSVLTITLTNQNNGNVNGVAFTDTYPSGLVNTATANATHNCALGTVTAADNGTSLSFSGGRVNGNSSCTITVNVTSATAGTYDNTTSTLTSSNAGNAPPASATLSVLARPAGGKSFAPASIGAGEVSVLGVTVTNANAVPLTNVAFTDTYPANLVNAATPGAVLTGAGCIGTVSASAGGNSVSLAGATIPANSSCTVTASVTSSTAGTYANTIAAGGITSGEAGPSSAAATGTLVVLARPTLAKAFSPTSVGVNLPSTLTLTLGNPNGVAITDAAVTDTYPANLVNAPTPAAATDCPGAALAAAAGAGSLSISGATIPAGGSCTVTVSVVATVAGSYVNTVPAGGLTTSNAGSNAAAASATLNVLTAPTATKSFVPSSIAAGGTSVLTIEVANGNAFAITGAGFTDNYPSGLVNAGTPSAAIAGPGCSGTVAAAAGGTSLVLSNATIPANASCTITANVTAAGAGSYVNSTGAIPTANAGTGTAASGTLLAFAAPAVAKSFSPNAIAAGGTSTMTIVVTNPAANPAALTGLALSDPYPAALTNTAAGSVACSAGGSATLTGGVNGGNAVGLSAATIAAGGTCTITQAVTASATVTNTTSAASSSEAPAGSGASATLTVYAAATITKAFSPTTVALGGTSTITFTLGNGNAIALTGGSFTDTMTGMVIDANGAAGGTCVGASSNSFTANQSSLSFTGLTIPASGSCTVTVVVRATSAGTLNNTTSGVTTTEAATGAPSNTAQLTVTSGSPTVAKVFTPTTIDPGAISQLVVTIGNPNAAEITVTTLVDNFPAGLAPAAVPNASTSCAGGNVSTNASGFTLTGGTVPANGSCTVALDVTSSSSGQGLVNTIAAGNLTTSAGANTAAGSATLNVRPAADVSVAKTGPATVMAGATVTYTIVVSNAGPQSADGASFGDTVPAALLGVAASCGSATGGAACGPVNVAGNAVTSTITALPSGGSVTFTVTGTAPTSGSFTNTAQVVTSSAVYDPTDPTRTGAGNNRSSVTTSIASPDLALTKSHAGSFTVGASGTYTITVNNTAGSAPTSGTITVTDNLPNGLTFVSGTGTGWNCSAAGQAVTCTTSSVIAAGAAGNPLTLTVSVGAAAAPSVTNTASVAGGGEPAAVAGNNNASDPTTVVSAGTSTFAPDNTLTASAGTTVSYAHTFSAGAAGTLSFSTSSVQSPVVAGWTQTIYRDSDCSGTLNGAEGTSPLSSTIAVNAADLVCIVVRDAIPLSAPQNAQNAITVSATLDAQTLTRTDLTIVGAGSGAGLVLHKQVRNLTLGGALTTANTARPNDVLEYTVAYTNTGGGPISAIVITDSTPSFTLYQAAACTLPLPASITACSVTTAPAVNGTGSISWTLTGSLQASASGTVTFTVRVQP